MNTAVDSTARASILRLGFKCSWWHPRQSNDAIASEPSIFSENHDYKSFSVSRCRGGHVRIPIFRDL